MAAVSVQYLYGISYSVHQRYILTFKIRLLIIALRYIHVALILSLHFVTNAYASIGTKDVKMKRKPESHFEMAIIG